MSKSTKRTPHDKFTIRLRPVGSLARFATNAALAGYVDLTACIIEQLTQFCESIERRRWEHSDPPLEPIKAALKRRK